MLRHVRLVPAAQSLQAMKKGMVICMSYVAPAVKDKFETLSTELKNTILERDVQLNTIHDLINVLDDIVKEGERKERP
jgi:hypothetical protein